MPQMKLGWMVVNGPEQSSSGARESLELLLDSYLSVLRCSEPCQVCSPLAMSSIRRSASDCAERRSAGCVGEEPDPNPGERSRLVGHPAEFPLSAPKKLGSLSLLIDHGIVVQPGYFFDMATEAYLVVSLLSNPEQFAAGLTTLKQLAER